MKLKDIIELIFFKTKISITVTFPFFSDKKQYILTRLPMRRDELLKAEEVQPFLDHDVDFINSCIGYDSESETYYNIIDVFVKG